MMTRNSSSRAMVCLTASFFIGSAAAGAMLPFIVVWAHRTAGLSGAAAGVLFVAQAVGEFGAGVLGGGLADRFGRRRVLVVSTTGMALAYGLLAMATQPAAAVGLFLLGGVFESAFHPAVLALVGDVAAEADLPRAFSILRIGSNAGQVVGPLLGALVALSALPQVFAAAGMLLALGAVLQYVMLPADAARRSSVVPDDDELEASRGVLGAIRHDRGLALLVLGGALIATTFAWWEADGLVLVRTQTSLGSTAYAALFTVAALTVVVGQLPVTRLTNRVPVRPVLVTGALVQALGLALLLAAPIGYPVLVVAVVLMATGEMIYGPTVSTVAVRRARPDQRASYQAALSVTQDIGTALGPVTGLSLGRGLGAPLLWAVAALGSVAGGVANWAGASSASARDRSGRRSPAEDLSRG